MTDVAPSIRPMPSGLTLVQGSWELLDRVEPLWNQQRDFHFRLAPQWKLGMTREFADRRVALIAKGAAGHFIALASIGNQDVGYGISTIDNKGRGELDSLFVDPEFRNQGIGDALMKVTLAWFAERAIEDIAIEAIACNEGAVRFYARYGYQPRSIVMKRPQQLELNVFQVWRIDDNGNVFTVGEPTSERDARCLVAEFEARGHKQMYRVAPTISTS
jgi:diamine N-acetyltransferase